MKGIILTAIGFMLFQFTEAQTGIACSIIFNHANLKDKYQCAFRASDLFQCLTKAEPVGKSAKCGQFDLTGCTVNATNCTSPSADFIKSCTENKGELFFSLTLKDTSKC